MSGTELDGELSGGYLGERGGATLSDADGAGVGADPAAAAAKTQSVGP